MWRSHAVRRSFTSPAAFVLEGLEHRRLLSGAAPTANPDSFIITQSSIVVGNVVDNDTDPENDTLTASPVGILSTSQGGGVNLDADGSFLYSAPNATWVGDDTFTYRANDGTSDSNEATVTITTLPTVSVADDQMPEGNAVGQEELRFRVGLNRPSPQEVLVHYRTRNGTAGEGDYAVINSGTITFPPGQTLRHVIVKIKGDTKFENDETFTVQLTGVNNAVLNRGSAIGTISNDDPVPSVFINEARIFEGNSGTRTLLFNVVLSNPSAQTITMNYATANFTAGEGDYQVKSGTLTFSPGQTRKTIAIVIKGDRKVENNEQFRVNLTNLVNVQPGDVQALGNILNDD